VDVQPMDVQGIFTAMKDTGAATPATSPSF